MNSSKNFKLVNADTDSITVTKQDGSVFSEEEQNSLLLELNSLFPERISWEPDGTFSRVIVIKAKNYILYDGKKIKTKGSALKASTKCGALKEFIARYIDVLVHDKGDMTEIYQEYVKEIMNIQDITRWTLRKTISDKIFTSERTNETKVKDAIEDTEYVEGDRVRMFYLPDDTLELEENFTGLYNRKRLLKNLFDTAGVFKPVIPTFKQTYLNYSLVRNIKPLYTVYNIADEPKEDIDEKSA